MMGSTQAFGGGYAGDGSGAHGHGLKQASGTAPQTAPADHLSGVWAKQLPDIPNYVVPAWAHDEKTRAAPWYLEVYQGTEHTGMVDLSSQARFLCGRSGGEMLGVDVDLGSHDTISRYQPSLAL